MHYQDYIGPSISCRNRLDKRGRYMFTGIIEEKGIIERLDISGSSGKIRIRAEKVLEGTRIGDSIAVNGICLTVVAFDENGFTADVMAETVRRSSLKSCRTGTEVNLERAMALGERFGGHIVAGHIDGTGVISELKKEENAVWVTIKTSPEIMRYVIKKGSIAIDGVSLTVAKTFDEGFAVSVIPHTGDETTLLDKHAGDMVNLENDIIGKYVEKLMGTKGSVTEEKSSRDSKVFDLDYLKEHGF